MNNLSQSSSHHKPVGGIRSVVLLSAANVAQAAFAEGGTICTSLEFVDDEALVECPLLEDASSFEEEITPDGGAVAVRHRVTLVADREEFNVWLAPKLSSESIGDGLCALVTLNSGCRLLLGYSERFEAQQPLRIISIKTESGSRPLDVPKVVMVLENFDTATSAVIV